MAAFEVALHIHRDIYSPRPGVAHKRGNPKTASSVWSLALGNKVDTVIRCHRES